MRRRRMRRHGVLPAVTHSVLPVFGGILLGLSYNHSGLFALTWVALVPLFIGLSPTQSLFSGWWHGTLFGGAAYATGTFWVADYIALLQNWSAPLSLAAAIPFWLYSAQVWGLAGILLVALARQSLLVPTALSTPTIIVAISLVFPHLFDAPLAVTQTAFNSMLQGISALGSAMLDWLIIAINALIALGLRSRLQRQMLCRQQRLAALGVAGLALVWISYGLISLSAWNQKMMTWPQVTIGVVQPNQFPQKQRHALVPGFSHSWSPELAMSERLAITQPDLIVWPESHSRDYFVDASVRAAYHRAVDRWQIPLLFQAVEPNLVKSSYAESNAPPSAFNSAIMLEPDQPQATAIYRKVNRIPIGEYVPPLLAPVAQKLLPWLGPFQREIAAGTRAHVQRTQSGLSVLPLICYDVLFASFVANAIPNEREHLLLITLSNDGWFGQLAATRLHTRLAALRAIENRIPLLHVTNNGPSAQISATGVITKISPYLTAGGYLTQVAVPDNRTSGTLYSQRPQLIPILMIAITLLLLTASVAARWFRIQ